MKGLIRSLGNRSRSLVNNVGYRQVLCKVYFYFERRFEVFDARVA